MSRSAQDALEFDKLRELLRQRTTSAPGHRHIDALAPTAGRAALDSQFALIRESREWLRSGRELGFGGLADPQPWLDRLQGVGPVLEPREFLDAATLLDTTAWLKPQFKEDAPKFPLLAARAASLADFRDLLAAIRRSTLPNAAISDDASPAAIAEPATQSKNPSAKSSAPATPTPAKTTSLSATIALSFPFAPNSAAPSPASCTAPAPPAKPFFSSRSKPSSPTINSSNSPKKKPPKSSAFCAASPSAFNPCAPRSSPLPKPSPNSTAPSPVHASPRISTPPLPNFPIRTSFVSTPLVIPSLKINSAAKIARSSRCRSNSVAKSASSSSAVPTPAAKPSL